MVCSILLLIGYCLLDPIVVVILTPVQGWQLPKGGGRNFATSTSHITRPSSPLESSSNIQSCIMQKGRKNEERNLNAWDRSFVKLDIPHNHTAHTIYT